jgi:hypothetical protein
VGSELKYIHANVTTTTSTIANDKNVIRRIATIRGPTATGRPERGGNVVDGSRYRTFRN